MFFKLRYFAKFYSFVCILLFKGEKLTLNVTILLSLVFYLQIISDYVPRGFSEIPLLTLFTLANFFLVFVSCVFTVLVLRLYYRTPSTMTADDQLPFVLRFLLFKLIGPMIFLKFHYRKRGETYERNPPPPQVSKNKPIRIKKTKWDLNVNREEHELLERIAQIDNEPEAVAEGGVEACTSKQSELDVCMRRLGSTLAANLTETINETEKEAETRPIELLRTLRLLNKCIVANAQLSQAHEAEEREAKQSEAKSAEKSLYYYEWKQASLILDRFVITYLHNNNFMNQLVVFDFLVFNLIQLKSGKESYFAGTSKSVNVKLEK
jgi:hypothetical protein